MNAWCLLGFPPQTTWTLLQMRGNCGKAATLVWHSILLLLANISHADFIGWTYTHHSLHQPTGKKQFQNTKYSREETYCSKLKKETPTKWPNRFTLQAWRVMSKVGLYCCFWHCHFRCWETRLQFVTSEVVMMQTGLWKAIKLLEQEHNKLQNLHPNSDKRLKVWPL